MKMKEHIRKILKEETLKNYLIDEIKYNGWDNISNYVGGDEELKNITGIRNARRFMKLFLNLTPTISKEKPLYVLYKNEMGERVIVIENFDPDYNENGGAYHAYFNVDLIFYPLKNFNETNKLGEKFSFLRDWLKDSYNIELRTIWDVFSFFDDNTNLPNE